MSVTDATTAAAATTAIGLFVLGTRVREILLRRFILLVPFCVPELCTVSMCFSTISV